MQKFFLCSALMCIGTLLPNLSSAQDYWQQRIRCEMEVEMDVRSFHYSGIQRLTYINHSPDTIRQVFYHLYFNAFQKGSALYEWTRNIPDPDPRQARILRYEPEDEGHLQVETLAQNGEPVVFRIQETILEVDLNTSLAPGDSMILHMQFAGKVPAITRRSGRNNGEGISLSMGQWYPRICVYDADGWHIDTYVGREYYGEFGDYDVKITIDSSYTVAAGGVLQNAGEIGHGYATGTVTRPAGDQLTWHFLANNVHDFVWAADPDYTHHVERTVDGVELHFFYQVKEPYLEHWLKLPAIMSAALDILNEKAGKYPYPVYCFIQGGDGGMEYPMATLMTGHRPLFSLVGVAIHEILHSWYQGILANDEVAYAWLDEGFANYMETEVFIALKQKGFLPADMPTEMLKERAYQGYLNFLQTGLDEPMSTPAHLFQTNAAYNFTAYTKGSLFLTNLEYLVGTDVLQKIMLEYFDTWKFKHPKPKDFMHVAEKTSGYDLDWFFEHWIETTMFIDYMIDTIEGNKNTSRIVMRRNGGIPMPLEVTVMDDEGNLMKYCIPIDLMRDPIWRSGESAQVADVWQWPVKEYSLELPVKARKIARVIIDPANRMTDVDRGNNVWVEDDSE